MPKTRRTIESSLFESLLVIILAGLAGPLIAAGPRPIVPAVVGELAAGIVLGRTGAGVIDPSTPTNAFLYSIGFAMLMLVAGSHVRLEGRLSSGLRTAAIAFVIVLAAAIPTGLAVGVLLAPSAPPALFPILLAGSSAAVAFPILQERGLLGPAVVLLLAWIPLADAVPVLVAFRCEAGCLPAEDQRRHNDPDARKRRYFKKYDLGKLDDTVRAAEHRR